MKITTDPCVPVPSGKGGTWRTTLPSLALWRPDEDSAFLSVEGVHVDAANPKTCYSFCRGSKLVGVMFGGAN